MGVGGPLSGSPAEMVEEGGGFSEPSNTAACRETGQLDMWLLFPRLEPTLCTDRRGREGIKLCFIRLHPSSWGTK